MDTTTPRPDQLEAVCFRPQAGLPALFKNMSTLADHIAQHSTVYKNKGSLVSLMSQCFRTTPSGSRHVPISLDTDILQAIARRLIDLERPDLIADVQKRYHSAVEDIIQQRKALQRSETHSIGVELFDHKTWAGATFFVRNVSELLRADALYAIMRNVVDSFLHNERVLMTICFSDEAQLLRFPERLILALDDWFSQHEVSQMTPARLQKLYSSSLEAKAIQLRTLPKSFQMLDRPFVMAERKTGEVTMIPLDNPSERLPVEMATIPNRMEQFELPSLKVVEGLSTERIAVLLDKPKLRKVVQPHVERARP